jgi:protein-tyrosine phosphatase
MIDLHAHVLPGVDGGPAEMAGSIAIARESEANGVVAIAATPHVRDDYPTTPRQMAESVRQVRLAWADAGVRLRLLPGAEIAFEQLALLEPPELWAFGLGGSPNHVLVEAPLFGWPLDTTERLRALREAGFTAVLAHPERSVAVQTSAALAAELVGCGTLLQLTAGSLTGRFGPAAARTARELLAAELVHLVASDTHRAGDRGTVLERALASIRDRRLVEWLTLEVPEAIIAGVPPPARPRRSSLLRPRRRG